MQPEVQSESVPPPQNSEQNSQAMHECPTRIGQPPDADLNQEFLDNINQLTIDEVGPHVCIQLQVANPSKADQAPSK